MDRSTSDESAGQTRGGWLQEAGAADASLALADPPPSMTAAHWANRDNETLYRRPGQSATPRRPPAENSFSDGAGAIPLPRRPLADPAADPQRGYPPPAGQAGYAPTDGYPPAPTDSYPPTGQDGYPPAPADGYQPPAQDGYTPAGQEAYAYSTAGPDGYPAAGAQDGYPQDGYPVGDEPADSAGDDQRARIWTSAGEQNRGPRTGDDAAAPAGAAAVRPAPRGPSGRPPAAGEAPAFGYGTGRPSVGRPASASGRSGGAPAEIGVLGGPGRDIRPHRASGGSGKDKPPNDQAAPRRSRPLLLLTLTLTVMLGASAGVVAMAVTTGRPAVLAAVLGTDDSDDAPAAATTTASAPLQGRTEGSFEIVAGATRMTLRSEDLGEDLYRVTPADDSNAVPSPVINDDAVQLYLTPGGDGTTGAVEVVLTSKVRWKLRFAGGADEQRVDMSQGRVASIDIAGGARRFELTLPPASGTVGVRLAGAVDEFVVTAPKASPVRVQMDSGAKTVAAGERTLRDIEPGSTIAPKAWQDADNRYDIDAAAKVSLLSITSES